MARKITGNHDGPNGENLTYSIPGRGDVLRRTLVQEVKAGKHPNHGVVTVGNREFVRAKPDGNTKNNVNPD